MASSTGKVLYPVQYARAFAALAVFYYHISATVASTYSGADVVVDAVGAAGVDLFFVVSGFVITLVVQRVEVFDIRAFATARLWRVVPLYWLITGFVFALAWVWPGKFVSTPADWTHLVHSLLFVPYAAPDAMAPVLLVGWTLNYEMFFYALVGLMTWTTGDRSLKYVALTLGMLALFGQVVSPESPRAQFYTDTILLEFVLGIGCFHLYRFTRDQARSIVWPMLLLTGLISLVLQFESDPGALRVVVWGVPSAMILLGGLHAVTWRNEFLRRLGDWSYALYLGHLFVVIGFVRVVVPHVGHWGLPWWAHYIAMTLILIMGSWVVHVLVERPLAGLPRRLSALRARGALPVVRASP